jgi:hypothetical protein
MGKTVEEWFAGIDTSATFLGKPIEASSGSVPGVHQVLVDRLRRVEARLVKELGASSPAECGRQLHVYSISGLRKPSTATGGSLPSMHCYGLAIDINYRGNPYFQPGAKAAPVVTSAVRLISGKNIDVFGKPPRNAGTAWEGFHEASDYFKAYLALRDPARRKGLEALAARVGRSSADLQAQIAKDHKELYHKSSFVRRDPAKGFLDLDKRLVVALVETGGLLWGGMYAHKGKDLMHFDWRGPNGAGRDNPKSWLIDAASSPATQSPKAVRPKHPSTAARADRAPLAAAPTTAAAPAASAPAASGMPRPDASVPGLTFYAKIPLGTDCYHVKKHGQIVCGNSFTLPERTGIYLPARFGDQEDIDVILYLHGHLIGGCGNRPTDQVDLYWKRPRFLLREGLHQTGRSFVLVLPSLGPQSQSGTLRRAGGFDRYMKQVEAAIVQQAASSGLTRPRSIGRIIVSCHSGGGSTMRAIATSTGEYARRIRECWGFDCLYGDADPGSWKRWAQAHPDARLYVHYTATAGTVSHSEQLHKAGLPNVRVALVREAHCDVPKAYWQRRIQAALRSGPLP